MTEDRPHLSSAGVLTIPFFQDAAGVTRAAACRWPDGRPGMLLYDQHGAIRAGVTFVANVPMVTIYHGPEPRYVVSLPSDAAPTIGAFIAGELVAIKTLPAAPGILEGVEGWPN